LLTGSWLKMAENKTKPSKKSAAEFINSIKDKEMKSDCLKLASIMKKATGEGPVMWGASVVGFGNVHYVYKSGREGDWMKTAFAPRKKNLTVYIFPGLEEYKQDMVKLGKYKTGMSCLYIRRLSDVDIKVLERIIVKSVKRFKSGVFKA
jgi:hypothetical protein